MKWGTLLFLQFPAKSNVILCRGIWSVKEFRVFTREFSIVLEPHGHPGSVLVTEGMLLVRIGSLIRPKNNR